MIRAALANPIAVLMACIAVVVFSAVVVPRLPVDTFPELSPPVLVIGTQAPGMGPRDVEKTLTWRFEKYVSATPGVDHVQSVSRAGLSVIFVWLKWGVDLSSAQVLVQQQVSFAMSSVPKSLGVVPPFVLQYDPSNAPVIQIAVSGGGLTGPQLYDYAANVIEPVIEGIGGVASASPNGGRERQINVVVDPAKASARGVSSAEVSAAVAKANALLPSGRLIAPALDANVYTNAVPTKVADIGDALIRVDAAGEPVRIKDVAKVEDGGAPNTQSVSINGEDAVYLNVLRVPGGNVLEIVDQVKAAIAGLKGLPPGMKVDPIFDQSLFVRQTYHGLQKELLQAFVLVSLVILLFLQSPRSVLVAALAVPISFAIILLVLALTGQTLNAFTLGGLTLALGPLVDISVVVLEAVHRRRLAGDSPQVAAAKGTASVALAALAATLATVAVLLPVVLLEGLARKLFTPLALTVAAGMFAGYAVSILVTPVACATLLGHHGPPPKLALLVERRIAALADGYGRILEQLIDRRALVLGCLAVLVSGAVVAALRLPSTFFPDVDESMERIYVRFAAGTPIDVASERTQAMAQALREGLPEGTVRTVLTNVGAPAKARSAMNSPNDGPHMGFIRVELTDEAERSFNQTELAAKAREVLTAKFPGVETRQLPGGLVASVFGNGYLAPLVVELDGDDLDQLRAQAEDVVRVARTVPGLRDPTIALQTDYPELRVTTAREAAGQVGVSARDAAQTVLDATLGNINAPGVWIDGSNGQSYFVVTQLDPRLVDDRRSLADAPVRTPGNSGAVLLRSYAGIERSTGPIAIERDRLGRVATVLFQTEGRDLGTTAADLEARLREASTTRGLSWRFVGQVDLMRRTFSGLGVAVGLAVMVVFMVMATQFKSLRLPLAMLLTVPASLVGIVLALQAAGLGFSITALMGVLMVIGIAVSNGILLVDHANRAFLGGMEARPAALEAARARVIPILMTSLATVIGLLPTALGLDPAAAANRPLALAVVGGLVSSTALSLFVVPVMFIALARRPAASTHAAHAEPAPA
ncbi:MAG: efflux RND transporter permease subunit [Myxococcaceae bacterium]|nr:efflux RND transporter permease subunit [Myxococcaceae bacterium]